MFARLGIPSRLLALACLLPGLLPGTAAAQDGEVLKADTVVTNARIVTMDNKDILATDPGSIVEAMAIREGRILDLGSNAEMLRRAKPNARRLDLGGKTVIPGLVETHVHPESTLNRAIESEERDAYQWAPGIHAAVQVEQDPEATLDKVRRLLRANPPRAGEWVHILMLPNEDTDYPDIGALTNGIYNDYITINDLSRLLPDNPASFGSGAGPSVVQQEGLVVRITVAPDGRSQTEALSMPTSSRFPRSAPPAGPSPFEDLFRANEASQRAEAVHAHIEQGCGWAEAYPHHLQHCSHRVIMLNDRAVEETLEIWPTFVEAANEIMSLTENAGDRGLVGGVLQDSGGWEKAVFPARTPRPLYTDLLKRALEHYASAGVSMIASSAEDGRTITAAFDLLRRDLRLPIRWGYGYEMIRDPRLYPAQYQMVSMIGAHQGTPKVNPWFWPMGITDGGVGDSRRVACFGEDLPGPELVKDREMCVDTENAYRYQRVLIPAIKAGWRPFSLHAFGSDIFRRHAAWIEQARVEGGMSMQDIRDLRIGFAHGGAIGKIPDVIQLMKDYNFYVPIQPNDVAASLEQVRRYGPEGLQFLAPTKTLLEAGVKIVGETEYSEVHPQIYFNALDMFVNRRIRDADAPEETGRIVMPEEAVSRATALRLYTSRAAEWLFAEDLVGSLEVGKLADFAVLDRDYFSVPREEILDNKVIMTVVGDQVVYQDPDWRPGGAPVAANP